MTSTPKPHPRSSLMVIRKGMLWFSVIATFLIGIRHLLPGEAASGGAFDAFCPFGAIETFWAYITSGNPLKSTNLLNFAVFSGVFGVTLVAGRAFCGWMCPVGAVQEWLVGLARHLGGEKQHTRGKLSISRFHMQFPHWADRPLRLVKYLILALILIASTAAIYPPLFSFCPARAVFSFKLTTGLMWSVLITFIATSLLVERIWCKYLCPLGAALAIFNKISPVRLQADFGSCNRCGRCDIECSMGIKDVPDNLSNTECIRCLECLETCTREEALIIKIGDVR